MHIGIDAGAKFLKIVHADNIGKIIPYMYCQHLGNPEREISHLLNGKEFESIERIVLTGIHVDHLVQVYKNAETVDEISAIIETLNYFQNKSSENRPYSGKIRYIVNVGAGSIKLIELDKNGDFYSYTENSLCAAGTGSFLDEQMHRMNFTYSDINAMPFIKDAPDVATRCAVFAKSDLIHRQQEGYTKEEMWSGLCRGVVVTMLQSVFKGDAPSDNILFCGGLFLNPLIKIYVKERVKNPLFHPDGHFFPAMGSLVLNGRHNSKKSIRSIKKNTDPGKDLNILKSRYSKPVDFAALKEYITAGLEVRIHREIKNNSNIAIGIDIGSTSTKLVAINSDTHEAVVDIYGKTNGNPVDATRGLFNELRNILSPYNYTVTSTGTTGSGRKLIGEVIGADAIINEITAHFKGSTFFDDKIETIFEIGGQDSKYIRGQNGIVVDCNMNFVCAAGTGSFIEEQASRLGFDVRDIGDLVIGHKTPHTSDRCTVFMEQDITKLLREGFSREEVLAGVIRSISKNYISKVVGSRPITGEKIFFQGATARNKGLVAAFENLLGKEIVVSPFCHVIGAFGAAIISGRRTPRGQSRFRGLDIFDQKIELEYSKCDKCANSCKITTARFNNGVEKSWGFMCGKETFEENKKNTSADHFLPLQFMSRYKIPDNIHKENTKENKNTTKIGIPFVLFMHNHAQLWKTFLEESNFDVIMSDKSGHGMKEKAVRMSKSESCFPIKLSLAKFKELSDRTDIDAIFCPTTLSEENQDNGMPRMLCPYVIAFPSIARETLNISKEIISPSIDFRQSREVIIDELYKSFKKYNFSKQKILKAYTAGIDRYKEYLKERYQYGRELLQKFKNTGRKGIVCIGRPYNLYDKILNLGLTERLKGYDMDVFPYECLIDPDENDSQIPYMYWNYGEKILKVADMIRDIPNIYPVYFTNFSCGPDSFILTRFEEIMRGKPYLIIELDEHGSETGYLTRIEAFIDVILEQQNEKNKAEFEKSISFTKSWNKKERKLWMPFMFEIAPRFIAAAFRGYGFNAEVLPLEDNEAYEAGKQNTRGSECLPACTTIGAFLKKMKEINADPSKHALIMATAEGPCRFGQYSTLHKSILKKNGMGEAEIFSPSSTNSYMGMKSELRRYLLDVISASDILSKYIYKIRPYEINKGETDAVAEMLIKDMEAKIESKLDLIPAMRKALARASEIPLETAEKPLVGLVGEIYVRSNPFCNNNVIRRIEESGGEAWLSPFSEWVIYTAWMERYFSRINKFGLFRRLGVYIKTSYMIKRMHEFEHALREYIPGRTEPPIERVLEAGRQYVPLEFEGEVILTIGRAITFLQDGASMVINCAPFSCMPGNITTSIFHNIQKDYDKSIVNLFYDGESDVNRIISIYLSNIINKK